MYFQPKWIECILNVAIKFLCLAVVALNPQREMYSICQFTSLCIHCAFYSNINILSGSNKIF